MNKKLNLYLGPGSGPVHEQHAKVMAENGFFWIFVDKYIEKEGWVKMDAGDLKYSAGSVDVIYASHLLEHFTIDQPHGSPIISAREALENWFKVLKIGGKVIINVPDFEWACEYFLKKQKDPDYWDSRDTQQHFNAENVLEIFFGGQGAKGEFHYSGFTLSSLKKLLSDVGFKDIEIKKMWDAHAMQVIFVEAYKGKI